MILDYGKTSVKQKTADKEMTTEFRELNIIQTFR